MQTITLLVEIHTQINDGVDPNEITFDIPIEKVIPMAEGKPVGTVTGYQTQEYFGE